MKISKSDFTFIYSGHGNYQVTYHSPTTKRLWQKKTNNMPLIDATMNEENPKLKDLNILKTFCKS